MGKIDRELMKNGSGYVDPTAYNAIKNMEKAEKSHENECVRFFKLLDVIHFICENAGFEVEGRIVLKDKKTGKVWR